MLKIRQMGFTLVELMVVVTIIGILMSVAIPSFQSWMLNTQTGNAAESIQNGLQRTRAAAVAHNTNTAFTLTDPAGINSSWSIDMVVPISGVPTNIDSRSSNEGSQKVRCIATPAGATTVTFNSFGGAVANAPVGGVIPPSITQIDCGLDLNNDLAWDVDKRQLRVTIAVGGSTRICDPNLPSSNPRGC